MSLCKWYLLVIYVWCLRISMVPKILFYKVISDSVENLRNFLSISLIPIKSFSAIQQPKYLPTWVRKNVKKPGFLHNSPWDLYVDLKKLAFYFPPLILGWHFKIKLTVHHTHICRKSKPCTQYSILKNFLYFIKMTWL